MPGRWEWATVALAAGLGAGAASAQTPSADHLADAARLGAVATLAPLCGLRDERWAEDLRRAEMQAATGTRAHDDPGLKRAPGADQAAAALSYADTEALESFAEAPAAATCGPLARDSELRRADGVVRRFRAQAGLTGPGT